MWAPHEIVFDLDPGASDAPFVTLVVGTPAGELRIMGELVEVGSRVRLMGAHMDGPGSQPFGRRCLGARPGHAPLAIRWRLGAR